MRWARGVPGAIRTTQDSLAIGKAQAVSSAGPGAVDTDAAPAKHSSPGGEGTAVMARPRSSMETSRPYRVLRVGPKGIDARHRQTYIGSVAARHEGGPLAAPACPPVFAFAAAVDATRSTIMGSARVCVRLFPTGSLRDWTDWFRQMGARCTRLAGCARAHQRGERERSAHGMGESPPERPRVQRHDA